MFALIVAYVLALHFAVVMQSWQLQALALTLVLAISLYGALTRPKLWAWLLLLLGAVAATAGARTVGANVFLYLPSVLMPLMLLAVFAPSLRAGRTPMVSKVALAIRGDLPEPLVLYTRHVTQLWTAIFLLMSLTHFVLAVWAPRELWSLVSNFVSYALVGFVFLAEHLYHRWRYSQFWHPTFFQFIKGLSKIDYRRLGSD